MDLKESGKTFLSIHEDFFELDQKEKRARLELAFDSPSDIFAQTVHAGIPVLSGEFLALLMDSFDYIPDRYKLDISVSFNDLGEYSEERLEEIFRKNLMLELRILGQKMRRRNRLVLVLCATGLAFVLLNVWLGRLWTDEGTVKDIVFFILDSSPGYTGSCHPYNSQAAACHGHLHNPHASPSRSSGP